MATKKELVTKENFEELLLESVNQVSDYIKGERDLRTHYATLIEEPPKYTKTKIKKIRNELGVSQAMFAKIFGESLSAIQHWEQGKRNMSKSASRLLNMLEKDSETALNLITSDKAS